MNRFVSRRYLLILLILFAFCFRMPVNAALDPSDGDFSSNTNSQNYTIRSSTMKNYLTKTASGYMRVTYSSSKKKVLIENFDQNRLIVSRQWLDPELPIFGGFYAGKDAYYLVYGQENPKEDDNTEVVRVVKYSTAWSRMKETSICGANTTIPFTAGSLRMTEANGYLYIHTCHQMYTHTDGLKHQANMFFQIRESDMALGTQNYEISNDSTGYASHSFNQFITADGNDIIILTHSDAYPRGMAIARYSNAATFNFKASVDKMVTFFSFKGSVGNNTTGASAGGLTYSDDNYLAVFNSVIQDDSFSSYKTRNVFIGTVAKDNFSTSPTTSVIALTDYTEGGAYSASTPQITKLSSDRFLVSWMETNSSNSKENKLCSVLVDGNGHSVGSIQKVDNASISDCAPIVENGEAVWFTTNGSTMTFSSIDSDNGYHKEYAHQDNKTPSLAFEKDSVTCGLVEGRIRNPLSITSDSERSPILPAILRLLMLMRKVLSP